MDVKLPVAPPSLSLGNNPADDLHLLVCHFPYPSLINRSMAVSLMEHPHTWFMLVRRKAPAYLLSYYLANKRSLHVRSQGLEISTLIGEK